MSSLVKSTVLGLGLLAGVGAVVHAQSVSSLPPSGPATQPATAAPAYSSSTQILPSPGGNSSWKEEHYQSTAGYDADKSQHPYSTSVGPQPGSHSSGKDEHYQATDQDDQPGRHPYTSNMGPKTN